VSKFWHCLTYHLQRLDVVDNEKGNNYYELWVWCHLYGGKEEDMQALRTRSISELRFKTGSYKMWSPPIFMNFPFVISHKYITTYFLKEFHVADVQELHTTSWLTIHIRYITASQPRATSQCGIHTHNRQPDIDYTVSLLHHRHLITFYFQVPMPSKTEKKRDPKLIHTTRYLVRNISRNTNKTLIAQQHLFIQSFYIFQIITLLSLGRHKNLHANWFKAHVDCM
jgi:hypothetical protein